MTAALDLPRVWASDELYTNGSAALTETKTDPGVAFTAEGLVPGRVGAQHLNHVLHSHSVVTRRARLHQALMQRRGTAACPSSGGLVAISRGPGTEHTYPLVCVKAGSAGVFLVHAGSTALDAVSTAGTSITSVTGIARSAGARVLVVGATSPYNVYSDDFGATWTDGATGMGSTPNSVVWTAAGGGLFVTQRADSTTFRSTDATSWSTGVGPGLSVEGSSSFCGLAVLSSGTIVTGGRTAAGNNLNFAASSNGGTSWSLIGNVPNAATIGSIGAGVVAGNGGAAVYHLGRLSTTQMQVSKSTNGSTWTAIATLTLPTGTFSSDPVMRVCADTGLMAIISINSTNIAAPMWVSDDGVSWEGPVSMPPGAIAVAGGRVLLSPGASVTLSDGIGWG